MGLMGFQPIQSRLQHKPSEAQSADRAVLWVFDYSVDVLSYSGRMCHNLPGRMGHVAGTLHSHLFSIALQNNCLKHFFSCLGELRPVKCPSGWMPYSGHCYMIYRAPKIWKEALSSCRKDGGDLASIHNTEEYSFTVSQLGYSEYCYRAVFCLLTFIT